MKKLLASLIASLLFACSTAPSKIAGEFDGLRQVTSKLFVGEYASCTGVYIQPRLLLTAAHCYLGEGTEYKVDGQKAVILKRDEAHDLMAMWVLSQDKHPYAKVASQSPQKDAGVVVVGYPLGVGPYVTEGRSQDVLKVPEAGEPTLFLAISAPIGPGNSGGPVFVRDGEEYKVAGIITRGGSIVYLAISLADIKEFLKDL